MESCGQSLSTCVTSVPPTQIWAQKLIPAKMVMKRQKNYEKRVLKKIQEETIEKLPDAQDLQSVKVWNSSFFLIQD